MSGGGPPASFQGYGGYGPQTQDPGAIAGIVKGVGSYAGSALSYFGYGGKEQPKPYDPYMGSGGGYDGPSGGGYYNPPASLGGGISSD